LPCGLELLPERLLAQRILGRRSRISKLGGDAHRVQTMVAADRSHPEVDLLCARRHQPARAEQLAEHDVAHPEPESRHVDAA
jgi:hypothetical protein